METTFEVEEVEGVPVLKITGQLSYQELKPLETNLDALVARGLVRKGLPVKLLGDGDVPRGMTVKVHKVCGSARRKVEEAGGQVEIVT